MRFLADVGISRSTLEALRALGHEVVHLTTEGLEKLYGPQTRRASGPKWRFAYRVSWVRAQLEVEVGESQRGLPGPRQAGQPIQLESNHSVKGRSFPSRPHSRRSFVLEKVAGARAVENIAYLVCVNQCGRVGPFAFHGASRVVDPLGDAVVTLANEETLVVVELDLGLVDRLRDRTDGRTYPLLDDRRPGLYSAPPGEAS